MGFIVIILVFFAFFEQKNSDVAICVYYYSIATCFFSFSRFLCLVIPCWSLFIPFFVFFRVTLYNVCKRNKKEADAMMLHPPKNCVEKVLNKYNLKQYSPNVVKYGLELIISSLSSIFIILITSIAFFSFQIGIIFLSIFILLRRYCGGYHANHYISCEISTLLTFLLVSICSRFLIINWFQHSMLVFICLIIFSIFAPVENHYKPLNKKKQIRCKLISVIMLVFCSALSIVLHWKNNEYFKPIIFTIAAITILIPIGIIKNALERRS